MKLLLALCFTASMGFAHDCLKKTDSLDQEYCFKKALKAVSSSNSKFEKSNRKGIESKNRNSRMSQTEKKIKDNAAYMEFLKQESELYVKHLAAVKKIKKKKKKEKKKNVLEQLGIKL